MLQVTVGARIEPPFDATIVEPRHRERRRAGPHVAGEIVATDPLRGRRRALARSKAAAGRSGRRWSQRRAASSTSSRVPRDLPEPPAARVKTEPRSSETRHAELLALVPQLEGNVPGRGYAPTTMTSERRISQRRGP